MNSQNLRTYGELLKKGASYKFIHDIEDDQLDILYDYGLSFYKKGSYLEAKNIFFSLTLIDQYNFDYHFALGLSNQKLGKFTDSLFCFSEAAKIKMYDPRPYYYLGLAYQIVGANDASLKSLDLASRLCSDHEKYFELKVNVAVAMAKTNLLNDKDTEDKGVAK